MTELCLVGKADVADYAVEILDAPNQADARCSWTGAILYGSTAAENIRGPCFATSSMREMYKKGSCP
jgi:hypothetical protein